MPARPGAAPQSFPVRGPDEPPVARLPHVASVPDDTSETAAVAPVRPELRLIGMAEDARDGVTERTAVVSGLNQVYLVKEGEQIAMRFLVKRIGADADRDRGPRRQHADPPRVALTRPFLRLVNGRIAAPASRLRPAGPRGPRILQSRRTVRGPMTMRSPFTVIAGPVAAAALLVSALPGRAQPPRFQSGVDVVVVDVAVVGGDGSPVASLTKEDFVLRVDGQPREITSVSVQDYTRADAARSAAAPTAAVAAGQSRPPDRTFLLLIDRSHISHGDWRKASQGGTGVRRLAARHRRGRRGRSCRRRRSRSGSTSRARR